jgi:hypothetical protein
MARKYPLNPRRLKVVREYKRKTHHHVAAGLNPPKSDAWMSGVERGTIQVDTEVAEDIAGFLGVRVEVLTQDPLDPWVQDRLVIRPFQGLDGELDFEPQPLEQAQDGEMGYPLIEWADLPRIHAGVTAESLNGRSRRVSWLGIGGPRSFCAKVEDDYMAPEIPKETLVILDPDCVPSSGEAVAALCEGQQSLCWYVDRGGEVSYRNGSGALDAEKVEIVAVVVVRLFPAAKKNRLRDPRKW